MFRDLLVRTLKLVAVCVVSALSIEAYAADPASPSTAAPVASTSTPATSRDTRYGFLDALGHRSIYGKYWFPEPLNSDEADVDNEIRFDYKHFENSGRLFNSGKFEIEKSFGLLTVEIAPGYESDRMAGFDSVLGRSRHETEEGWTNVELGARYPFFQYVSPDGKFDTTFVFGLEVAVPTLSKISKDTEIVPKVFNLTRIGDHFSIQTGLGDSIVVGPEERGASALEYNATFGYELTKKDLPIPGVLSTVPIFELDGEYALNHQDAGHNQLFGVVGVRLNFDTISWMLAQPRIGLGYVFPIDKGARDEFRWGAIVSLIFEY
jgi:hypothetical protein